MEGSDEFAMQVFDSLARKRGIVKEVLTKEELKDFWEQLSDQGFDTRLRTFFDMLVLCVSFFIDVQYAMNLPSPNFTSKYLAQLTCNLTKFSSKTIGTNLSMVIQPFHIAINMCSTLCAGLTRILTEESQQRRLRRLVRRLGTENLMSSCCTFKVLNK